MTLRPEPSHKRLRHLSHVAGDEDGGGGAEQKLAVDRFIGLGLRSFSPQSLPSS